MTNTIAITGAASGIGRAVARVFAGNGWHVGLFDRDAAALDALVQELGVQGNSFVVDVCHAEDLANQLSVYATQHDGSFDILFAAAGIYELRPHMEVPLARQHELVDVNVNGVLNAINAALPLLRRSPAARIITMCSTCAVYGFPGCAVYSATKFFVRGLTEALNLELAEEDIWVCDLMVGFVDTPMTRTPTCGVDLVERHNVLIKPSDVADVVWQAAIDKKVHWIVDDASRGLIDQLDKLSWEESGARLQLIIKQAM